MEKSEQQEGKESRRERGEEKQFIFVNDVRPSRRSQAKALRRQGLRAVPPGDVTRTKQGGAEGRAGFRDLRRVRDSTSR